MSILLTGSKLQVFYDGACPICRREVGYYRGRDLVGRIEWVDIAAAGFEARAYGLDPVRVHWVMHVRMKDGRVFTEVWAFVKIWEALPAEVWTTLLWWFLKVPGMLAVSGVFYRMFARNRMKFTGRCTKESCAVDGK